MFARLPAAIKRQGPIRERTVPEALGGERNFIVNIHETV
jgi:hypothetical protein